MSERPPEDAGAPDSSSGGDAEEAMAKAMAHPIRARVLFLLADEPDASAEQIAKRIAKPVRSVRHQLSELTKVGLVEPVEERKRRGVVERFYRVTARPVVEDQQFAKLSPTERVHVCTQCLRHSYTVASGAMVGGTLYARDDMGIVNQQAALDPQGWRELVEANRAAQKEIERVKTESAARLEMGAVEPIWVGSTLMWFELPPPGERGST